MGIGTFGVFTQAKLAIYAAQTGISVTGNNISNINTPGYTRQRLNQVSLSVAGADRYYAPSDVRTGQGVLARSISQIRNPYLDIRFREENAKVGYMNARLEGLDSIARVLDEVGKGVDKDEGFGVVAQEINKLISSLQNLATETGHQEYDNIVRQVASNLVSRLNSYAARLEEVRQNTITSYEQNVDRVNEILTSIRSYNEEIRKSDIHGDPALELRDERNLLIDELSGLIDISVTYSEETISAGLTVEKLTIRLGDANPDRMAETDESLLVDGVYCAQIGRPMRNPYYGESLENPSEKLQELMKQLNLDPDTMDEDGLRDALADYVNFQYWNQGMNAPVEDMADATVDPKGVDTENFDLMISDLRNKADEVLKSIKKVEEIQVDGSGIKFTIPAPTDEDPDATEEKTLAELIGKASSYRVEEQDKPSEGDTTITIYKKLLSATGKPMLDNNGNPIYVKQVYHQILSKPVLLDDNDLGGELQANRELLTEKGEFVDESVYMGVDGKEPVDENALSKRGIQYYQRSLDLLANQLAKILNEANQGFYVDPSGNYVSTKTELDEYGKEVALPVTLTSGTVLNQNVSLSELENADDRAEILEAVGLTDIDATDVEAMEAALEAAGLTGQDVISAYLKGQTYENGELKDPDPDDDTLPRGIFVGGNLFSNDGNSDDDTNITAANISISKTWLTNHILVRDFVCPVGESEPASGKSDNILHMKYLLDVQKWDFNPNALEATSGANGAPMFNGTIYEFWNNVGFTLGKDQDYANTELTVAYETALSIDTDRSSVSSVDFNDEAMNLMMYSKSYNAACRLMTTIDSMIDKLVNGTGLTT